MEVLRAQAWLTAPELPDAGLIVFEDDPTSGPSMERLFAGHARIQVARMPFSKPGDNRLDLVARAARQILPSTPPALIGVACTTLGMEFGQERLTETVSRPDLSICTSDPMQAILAALATLRIQRPAIVCPYGPLMAERVAATVSANGSNPRALAFMDVPNSDLPSISKQSLISAVRQAVGTGADRADAVLLSCTGLDTLGLIEPLEEELGVPVLTSIQALAWDMARQLALRLDGPGKLFSADRLRPPRSVVPSA